MKKIILYIICVFMLAGCSSFYNSHQNAQHEVLTILSPTGAPALSLVDIYPDENTEITFVEGADVIQAAFVQPESEYDIIIAPTNLGVKLASANKTYYRLAAVITWGNLYVLAKENAVSALDEAVFAAFGEQAVPGLVFEAVKDQLEVQDLTYYSAVTEAQAALLSNQADAALIAEPAATATISKAKEKGIDLVIAADIQSLWENKTGSQGYPQASIFVRETEENKDEIDLFLNDVQTSMNHYASMAGNNSVDEIVKAIEAVGIETLGVPNAKVVAKSYKRLGLCYRDAKECEKELSDFLSLFGIDYNPESVLR